MRTAGIPLLSLVTLAAACSGEGSPVPAGVEVAVVDGASISGRAFAATDEGFALVWAELEAGGDEEQLVLTRLDQNGVVVGGPTILMGLGSASWTELALVPTPSGLAVWYWRSGTRISVVVIDRNGAVLATRETEERLDSGRRDASMAAIADSVAVAYRNASDQVTLRIYGDQGMPRTAAVSVEAGNRPRVVAGDDRFELLWDEGGNIRRATFGLDGTQQRAPETVASDPDVSLRSPVATWVAGGLFFGFVREESLGDGAGFHFVRDDGTGWPEPHILFPPNRLESLDLDVAGWGDRSYVVWQSDAEAALPRLRSGVIDLGADERALTGQIGLTPEGVWAGGFEFAEHADGVGAVLQTEARGASQIYFRQFAP